MTTVSMKQAKDQFTALARLAEGGETVVVTRNGKPVVELVAHKPKKGGINLAAGRAFLRRHGVTKVFTYVADNFDDPLPEDFLLKPLPR